MLVPEFQNITDVLQKFNKTELPLLLTAFAVYYRIAVALKLLTGSV